MTVSICIGILCSGCIELKRKAVNSSYRPFVSSASQTRLPTVKISSSNHKQSFIKEKTVVRDVKFERTDRLSRGIWSGTVKGDNVVELFLENYSKDQLVERRFMGATVLKGKSTTFIFESHIPDVKDWTWRVVILP